MAVNRSGPSWRAWLRSLLLPFNDLGIEGGPGKILNIPDDVLVALTYPVSQNAQGSRVLQGLTSGAVVVSPPVPGTSNYFATDQQSVGAASNVTYTWGFEPSLIIISCNTVALPFRFTMINGGTFCRVYLAINATLLLTIPASGVFINNAGGSAANHAVTVFGK